MHALDKRQKDLDSLGLLTCPSSLPPLAPVQIDLIPSFRLRFSVVLVSRFPLLAP